MLKKFSRDSGVTKKDVLIIVILLVNALSWFYTAPIILNKIILENALNTQEIIIFSGYYIGIVLCICVGAVITKKINRIKLIYLWTIFGIIASLIPIFYNSFTWIDALIISCFLGASFGLGIPSCLAYFADVTHFENRGRLSGITLLAANLFAPIFFIISHPSIGLDLKSILVLFAIWRSIGSIAFFLKPKETSLTSEKKPSESFSEILKEKTFSFYIIAWIMFCLVDRIAGPIVSNSPEIITYAGPIIASISALIAGIMADWIGRKRIVLYGFILLGIAYAIIGIAPNEALAMHFFIVINSITTGILLVTFILVLWGDISKPGSRAKYYALGGIPLFLTLIIQLLLEPYIKKIGSTSVFSVAAFFLFLAVLPLLYAPETIPEKKIELKRLRSFADEAMRTREKYEQKLKKIKN